MRAPLVGRMVGGTIILAMGGDVQQFKLPLQIVGGMVGFVISMGFLRFGCVGYSGRDSGICAWRS